MNESQDDGKKTSSEDNKSKRPIERFTVRRGIAGWYLVPADAQHHPLLARLFGPDEKGNPPGETVRWEYRKGLDWESLEDGLRRIRNIGRESGLGVRICGNLRKQPTVLLWERELWPPIVELPARPFDGFRGDYAAKWGISDFYEEHEQALRAVLATGGAFDTGWFGVKKEIQSGRVFREKRNGPVFIEVSASMDEWNDVVDTAVGAAWGKRLEAGSGLEVLTKLGLPEEEATDWLERMADRQAEYCELGEDNSTRREATLARNVGYVRLCERLDELADECEKELKSVYEAAVEDCARELEELRKEQGASCATCKFFNPAIPESRVNPEDPADCGHPKYYALLSRNKAFPFVNGCKFWQAKWPGRKK